MMLLGEHVTTEAEGAWHNGTKVKKARFREGDKHPVGAIAKVIGSVKVTEGPLTGNVFYFVEWDDLPGIACGVAGNVLEPLS